MRTFKQIERRPAALRDAARIWDYIARDNEDAADAQIDRFDDKLSRIAENPGIGSIRDEIRPGLRSVAVGRYLLLCRIAADRIILVRIMHSAQDVPRRLNR